MALPRTATVRIRNPLGDMGPVQLQESVHHFHQTTSETLTGLRPYPSEDEMQDAARVGQNQTYYYNAARANDLTTPVPLNAAQCKALVKEVDHSFSEKGMWMVILTVSLSAFLQGFVQSSQNGANLFADLWISKAESGKAASTDSRYALANAAVYFSAAILGCPLAAPLNSLFGRRGVIFLAALLIFISSVGQAAIPLNTSERDGIGGTGKNRGWALLSGLRCIGGLAMGLKAVSTPILAAETAIGSWRGSSILAWQLWVAFGIMTSFIVNILLNLIPNPELKLRLIMASPAVFALVLMLVVFKCPESFRYYMTPDSKHYKPEKAFGSLLRLRNTRLQATRDLFVTHIGVEQEAAIEREARSRRNETPTNHPYVVNDDHGDHLASDSVASRVSPQNQPPPTQDKATTRKRGGPFRGVLFRVQKIFAAIWHYALKYWDILMNRRLRNAAIASSVVALAQQLSGINIMAFYGGSVLVQGVGVNRRLSDDEVYKAMVYNVIFGLLNFLFCLPAIRYVDTLGRRRILLFTIPGMALGLMAAAVSFNRVKVEVVAWWLYFHCMWYSPGMGPIPFILAAESFSLATRETGASVPISINLFFAGLLAFIFPHLLNAINYAGTLGLFAGFNVIAFVSIFLLVEETGGVRLEALGLVFRERKRDFIRFQVRVFLPWLGRFLLLKESWGSRPRRMVNYEKGKVDVVQQDGGGLGSMTTIEPVSGAGGTEGGDRSSDEGTAPMV